MRGETREWARESFLPRKQRGGKPKQPEPATSHCYPWHCTLVHRPQMKAPTQEIRGYAHAYVCGHICKCKQALCGQDLNPHLALHVRAASVASRSPPGMLPLSLVLTGHLCTSYTQCEGTVFDPYRSLPTRWSDLQTGTASGSPCALSACTWSGPHECVSE